MNLEACNLLGRWVSRLITCWKYASLLTEEEPRSSTLDERHYNKQEHKHTSGTGSYRPHNGILGTQQLSKESVRNYC